MNKLRRLFWRKCWAGRALAQPTVLAVIGVMLFPSLALADWIDPGVAYKCDRHNGTFVLTAIMETSSPEDVGEIPVEEGFRVLSKNKNFTNIKCSIKGIQVSAFIERRPPAERGMCAAYNHFTLRHFQVNENSILKYELFNSGCFFSPVLYRIELHAHRNAFALKSCRGEWDWGKGYGEGKCDESTFSLNHLTGPAQKAVQAAGAKR